MTAVIKDSHLVTLCCQFLLKSSPSDYDDNKFSQEHVGIRFCKRVEIPWYAKLTLSLANEIEHKNNELIFMYIDTYISNIIAKSYFTLNV